jgi:tetratricopeptide (TPR) repeat protein
MIRDRINEHWMRSGVTIIDPTTTWIDSTVQLAQDVTVHPGTALFGKTTVASGAVIGPRSTLTDCKVKAGAKVLESIAIETVIGEGATVGPFTYLRAGTELGDSSKALTAYRAGLVITKALALQNPTNTQWRHQFFVSKRNIGNALLEQGDRQGALRSYQAALEIAEDLAQQDSTSTQWQVDIAVCCKKLSSLDSLLSISDRREYLLRGRQVLLDLKKAVRLLASQDGTGWFDQALKDLE